MCSSVYQLNTMSFVRAGSRVECYFQQLLTFTGNVILRSPSDADTTKVSTTTACLAAEQRQTRLFLAAGSGTGGGSPGLPLDVDPKDATSTDRIDDPEQLFKRRRAKDPIAFDKVHGHGATLHDETDGHKQGELIPLFSAIAQVQHVAIQVMHL